MILFNIGLLKLHMVPVPRITKMLRNIEKSSESRFPAYRLNTSEAKYYFTTVRIHMAKHILKISDSCQEWWVQFSFEWLVSPIVVCIYSTIQLLWTSSWSCLFRNSMKCFKHAEQLSGVSFEFRVIPIHPIYLKRSTTGEQFFPSLVSPLLGLGLYIPLLSCPYT